MAVSPAVISPGMDIAERKVLIEDHVSRETRGRLSDRLLNESPTAELVHLLLISIVAGIIWGRVPNSTVYLWVSAVVLVTGLRFTLRRLFCSRGGTAESIYLAMRGSILLSGLAWGLGVLLLSGRLGHEELALILVVFAGLVAGATSTLVADRVSFHIFSAAMLLPLIGGILISGSDRFHIFAAFLTFLYGMIISIIHLRSHRQTIRHLEVNVRLELSDILLETERDRLQAFFERAPIAIAMVDRNSVILDINPGFTSIFGYQRDEAVGADLNLLVVPEGEVDQARAYDRQVDGDEATIIETLRKSKTGNLIPVQASAIHSTAGPEALTFVIYDDITRIKEAQATVELTERELRLRNKISNAFLASNDEEVFGEILQMILETFESEYGIFGYIDDEGSWVCPSMTRDIWDSCQMPDKNIVFPEESWPGFWGKSMRERVSAFLNEPFTVPEGHLPVHRALNVPIVHQDTLIGNFLIGNKETDYTDADLHLLEVLAANIAPIMSARLQRDREEEERREAEEALRDAEEQYRRLVESASDMVWEVDSEGRWSFLNSAAENILGTSRDILLGQPFIEYMDPEEVERGMQKFQLVLSGEELIDFEIVFFSSDGEPRNLSFAARPILDSRGVITGARGIARDVTARAEARVVLEEARISAEQMAQARTSFLANMSHEIRTPMNGILGMTELLLDSELTPEQRTSAQLVRTSADALLRIINDILDFSKIESGHFAIEEIPFDLAVVVDSTLRTFVVPAFERGIELVSDIHPDVPEMVTGDPGRLRQVLNNLIGNAVKFTHKGEIAVTVASFTDPDEGAFLRFGVRDTGIGIPEEKLDSIFEEFSQADVSTTREYGGTGLGLAISNRIVGLMGGTIVVTSTVGEGSEFSFRIPLKISESEVHPAGERERITLSGVRAIVVDDNATNRRIVREMLGAVGISVHEAEDADAGLARLHQAASEDNAYDLAVIDGYMPGRDGFEMAEIIRGDPVLKNTKMMLLSSGARKGDGQRCREIGVQAYLTKPVSRTDLLEATIVVLTETKDELPAGRLVTRHSIEETRPHRRILLAEDNPVNQKVASTMLRKRGHTVDIVENGQEAVNAVRSNTYDIVLMDIQMPTMDGIDAVREIRSDHQFADLPIIALTAHALEGDEERFLEAGMNGYVSKPFRPHQLYAVVEEWTSDPVSDSAGKQTDDEESPPVDLESFRETMREAGAEDAVESMLELFLDDAPGRMEALQAAAAGGEVEEIARAAHAYKSAAATIGATELASILNTIEARAKMNEIEGAIGHIERAQTQHTAVLEHLRAHMQ